MFTIKSASTNEDIKGKFFLSNDGKLYKAVFGLYIPVKREEKYIIDYKYGREIY